MGIFDAVILKVIRYLQARSFLFLFLFYFFLLLFFLHEYAKVLSVVIGYASTNVSEGLITLRMQHR